MLNIQESGCEWISFSFRSDGERRRPCLINDGGSEGDSGVSRASRGARGPQHLPAAFFFVEALCGTDSRRLTRRRPASASRLYVRDVTRVRTVTFYDEHRRG